MSDPVSIIGASPAAGAAMTSRPAPVTGPGGGFGQLLLEKIAQVDRMQRDADHALAQLAGGPRDDIGRVMLAQQKADEAFKVLLQVRDTLQNAYDEIKQMRV